MPNLLRNVNRTPPEYIPRLIAYQLKYEELIKKLGKEDIEE
ncbi:hypothetical protein [[Ruminococcus] lactaris]|nr:hypothetical protein [[Ruminococcus] lactaris]MDE8701253.1 hypothetical protein [[Ruminococcus] lactaris]